MLLMQRDSKNSRLGPQSVAGSYVSNRSEGQKSLASLASMMSEKVPNTQLMHHAFMQLLICSRLSPSPWMCCCWLCWDYVLHSDVMSTATHMTGMSDISKI